MKLWVSCKQMTVLVEVDQDTQKVTDAAPIVRRFIGQPFYNLTTWLKRFGPIQVETL